MSFQEIITADTPATDNLTSAINFHASVGDVFDARGNRVPSELGRGVYRSDTGELMSICGPNTVPIQHKDIVDPILMQLEQSGYKLEERPNNTRGALYDLKGKKGAFISTDLTDNGAVMRVDIILGDFVNVTHPNARFGLAYGEDTNLFKISLLNSHNSKYAARANTSYERIECLNGMTSPGYSASAYGKHTANFNLKAMQAQLGNAFEAMTMDQERFELWAKTKINVLQAEEGLKRTIAKLPNKPNGDAHFSEPLVNKILARFVGVEDQTVWGLFNAVTWWQTHSEFRSNANSVTALIGREQKVAQMVKSNPWAQFITEAA